MRTLTKAALLLALVGPIVPATVLAGEEPARPNIILILADDQGYADVSFRNSAIETPNLDALAAGGAVLNRFYVCPVCSPTRAGLLTGRYPIRFGMQRAVNRPFSKLGLPEEEETLPELLAMAGYQHRHMVGKWHLGNMRWEHLPLRQGFTSYYGPYCAGIDYFKHTRQGEHDFHRDDETVFEEGYATDLLSAEAVRLVRSHANDDEPFFLYLPHSAPHTPIQAPAADVAAYMEKGLDKQHATYAAMISSIDKGVGDLVLALEETGQRDDTLIIYVSDNGAISLGSNAPFRGGKGTIYEGGIRVIAFANWPGKIPSGTEVDAPCSYIDIVPTLCAVAGLDHEPAHGWDGRNVMPLWRGADNADPNWEFFSFFERQTPNSEELVMTTNRFKLIRRGKPILECADPSANAAVELYDLSNDIAETTNIADEHRERVKGMLDEIASFRKLRPAYGVGAQPEPSPPGWKPSPNWELTPPESLAQ